MLITSLENNRIKNINKLKQKKYRDKENKFIIETMNLIKEAYENGVLEEIYILENETLPFKVNIPIYEITQNIIDKIKSVNTSKIIGICKLNKEKSLIGSKYLILDSVQDPGNLGTIIRSSVAFGIDTIILSNTCCDIYNDKVLRATEGAIFKINIIREDLTKIIKDIKVPIYGTDVIKGISPNEIKKDSFAIIMGSEGNGISDEIKKLVNKNIHINIKNVESLNVAVATSIILYELSK